MSRSHLLVFGDVRNESIAEISASKTTTVDASQLERFITEYYNVAGYRYDMEEFDNYLYKVAQRIFEVKTLAVTAIIFDEQCYNRCKSVVVHKGEKTYGLQIRMPDLTLVDTIETICRHADEKLYVDDGSSLRKLSIVAAY